MTPPSLHLLLSLLCLHLAAHVPFWQLFSLRSPAETLEPKKVFGQLPALLATTACLTVTSFAAAGSGSKDGVLEKRGTGSIRDIVSTIHSKGVSGTAFCSTFLHIPSTPRTTVVTVTKTVSGTTKPASTVTRISVVTRTASIFTRTIPSVSVVGVTPTVQQTAVTSIPFTSTVNTVTSLVTSTETATVTVTSFSEFPPLKRKSSTITTKVPIPRWLNGHCSSAISRACSHVATQRICTKTSTVKFTRTAKAGLCGRSIQGRSSLLSNAVRPSTPAASFHWQSWHTDAQDAASFGMRSVAHLLHASRDGRGP
ncbi:hypothetical protein V8E36_008350 [Tilletia maclaganii]